MIPGSKGLKSDAGSLGGGFLNLGSAENMKKEAERGGFFMFLRIAGAQSAEQSGIKGVKRPFDPDIMSYYIKELVAVHGGAQQKRLARKGTDAFVKCAGPMRRIYRQRAVRAM